MTKDLIQIEGIRIMAFCGNLPEEQERRQPFEIDLHITFDISPAAKSDDLNQTIDYVWMIEAINKYFEKNKIKLIERMAQIVADIAFQDERIQEINVKIRKLQPPVSQPIGSAGISITRTRD